MTNFQTQFEKLKELHLPAGQFLVVGSGPMSVRGMRDSEDLDVIVTPELWNELIKTYLVERNSWDVECIHIGEKIETLNPAESLFGNSRIVPVEEVYAQADTFDGIKFLNLEHLKIFKKELGREKDLKDIEMIDKFFYEQNSIKQLESEGFDKIWIYQAEPNEIDEEHDHNFDTKIRILEGDIRVKFFDGEKIADYKFLPGQEISIPRKMRHWAKVGPGGCRYIVAEKM